MRFQFVRKGVSPRMGGVYRIVQVPLNYTFAHLRILVAFLFGSPASSSRLGDKAGSRSEEEDYLFEVVSKATLYSPLYKPGQIKSGKTTTKLSNRRDPCRWNVGYGYADDDDEEEEEDELEEESLGASTVLDLEDEVLAEMEEKPGEWKWESEEDYVLGHVWPDGLDIRCGIIYVRLFRSKSPTRLTFCLGLASLFNYSSPHHCQRQAHSRTKGLLQHSLRLPGSWAGSPIQTATPQTKVHGTTLITLTSLLSVKISQAKGKIGRPIPNCR